MARARNIKPAFFDNEVLGDLSFETRLMFIGLWTLADREGRLEDRPKRIRIRVFPFDDVDADKMLQALHESGFILRYTGDDENPYIQILKFTEHQTPHCKEKASTIPAPCKVGASTSVAPPDSLIPDSLIPDSPSRGGKPPKTNTRHAPSSLPKPDFLENQVWNDYRSFRSSKKAKLTPTAWKRIQNELERGIAKGHDPNDMLGEAMEAGWTGFKCEWYENRINPSPKSQTSDDRFRGAL